MGFSTRMLGARHFGAILAAGLTALIGANVFSGSSSEANMFEGTSSESSSSDQKVGSFLTPGHLETFHKDGIVIVDGLLTEKELKEATSELISRMEKHVAEGVAVDDALTNHPNFLAAASQILDSPRLRLFSSRLLCKMLGT